MNRFPGKLTVFPAARQAMAAAAVTLLWVGSGVSGQAQSDVHAHHGGDALKAVAEMKAVGVLRIPDVTLLNEDGKSVRFYSDLVKGRVVAVNTVFTTCTTICPLMGVNFAALQREKVIGSRLGRDLLLISISVDPAVDTPERLKLWSGKLGAKPGWTLLTGDKQGVVELLKALNVFTPDKESHTPVMLIGSEASSEWVRVNGLAPPGDLAHAIRGFLESGADR